MTDASQWRESNTPTAPWGDEITPLTEVADGRYVLLHELAKGDRSIVYRAKPRGGAVSIAFKVIQPRYVGDEAQVRRFCREAELLRKIEHPNIVRLVEQGTIEDGRDFIALELLVGQTLGEALEGGTRMTAKRTCLIARQVAEALAAMHRAGVIHRDLQPENILLIGSEAREQIKLVDLSDAGDVGAPARSVRASRRRDSGGILADGYRSPEQIRKRPPHPSMDVFALGVIMFEMLAGEHPFANTLSTKQPRLGARTIRTKVFDAPEEVLGLVGDCIELEAKERPASIEEVITRLDKALLWMGVVPPKGPTNADEEAPTQAYRAAADDDADEPDKVEQRVGAVKGSFDAESVPGGRVEDVLEELEPVDSAWGGTVTERPEASAAEADAERDAETERDAEAEPESISGSGSSSSRSSSRVRDRPAQDNAPFVEAETPEPDAPRSSESMPRIDLEEIAARAAAKGERAVVDTIAWTKPQRSAEPVSRQKPRTPEPEADAAYCPPRWAVPLLSVIVVLLALAVWIVWSR